MGYVALIGLYFVPILCLLSAGWSYVRWKNEHENEALAERAHRNCRRFLIATPVAVVVFLALKFIFPVACQQKKHPGGGAFITDS